MYIIYWFSNLPNIGNFLACKTEMFFCLISSKTYCGCFHNFRVCSGQKNNSAWLVDKNPNCSHTSIGLI